MEGQGGASLNNLEGVSIPVIVNGSLESPNYGIDIADIAKQEIKKEVKKEVEKKVKKKLLDLLGG